MSYVNLILNHLMRIKKSLHWIFLSYMNEEVIFESFPGSGNVIASDAARAVSNLHSRDIVHRDIKPANVFMSKSHYKHEDWRLAKRLLSVDFVIWGKRNLCIHRLTF